MVFASTSGINIAGICSVVPKDIKTTDSLSKTFGESHIDHVKKFIGIKKLIIYLQKIPFSDIK